jgi:hypothetical protein
MIVKSDAISMVLVNFLMERVRAAGFAGIVG